MYLQSHRQERQESRQSSPSADTEESTAVSDKQSLSQHPDDYINITESEIWKTSQERCYNIRIWLTPRKEETVMKKKRDPVHMGFEKGGRKIRICFINTEGLKSQLHNRDFLDLLEENEMMVLAESWTGLEKYKIRGYKSFVKSRYKIKRYRRIPGGLVFIQADPCIHGFSIRGFSYPWFTAAPKFEKLKKY
jgi:hypothetical protein